MILIFLITPMIKIDTTISGRLRAEYFKSTFKSISYTSLTIEWE